MNSFFHSRLLAFKYAIEGWWYVLRTQRNAWIHAFFSIFAIILSGWLHLGPRDWALLIFAIALVWIAEFLNTAIEAILDLVHPKHHDLVKVGKDVSAAAVLIASGASVLIGLLVLGPPLWAKIF